MSVLSLTDLIYNAIRKQVVGSLGCNAQGTNLNSPQVIKLVMGREAYKITVERIA
jgi:hypothetical protein